MDDGAKMMDDYAFLMDDGSKPERYYAFITDDDGFLMHDDAKKKRFLKKEAYF
jgi:hypothetical protein